MPLAALHRVEALKTLTTMLTTTESDMARSQRMASEAASQVSDVLHNPGVFCNQVV